jgi:thymidylate synthase (FAD)
MKDEFYVPSAEAVALQSEDNRQGRASEPAPVELTAETLERLEAGQRSAYADYKEMIDAGISRELARIDLPLSLYTEWYWQIDLHNLFRFLVLRLDAHAQFEIREYARILLDIARTVAPAACASFENHLLGGTRFSAEEMEELRRRLGASSGARAEGRDGTSLEGKKLERFEEKLRTGRQL